MADTFDDIHSGDYGWTAVLTVKEDDVAQDISAYTTRQYLITDPSGNVATVTASFNTDGTDGKLTYTVLTGDIDEPGPWAIQARITKSAPNARHTSNKIRFQVEP